MCPGLKQVKWGELWPMLLFSSAASKASEIGLFRITLEGFDSVA